MLAHQRFVSAAYLYVVRLVRQGLRASHAKGKVCISKMRTLRLGMGFIPSKEQGKDGMANNP